MKIFKKTAVLLLALSMCGCACAAGEVETLPSAVTTTGGYSSDSVQTGTDGSANAVVPNAPSNGAINTGALSENASEYEGTEGTGDYNYGEALQKSLLFYELQRSGDLPENTRCNWRGDSALSDGSDNGVDLSGGLYDAGDNAKFNLPMAYTSAMLAWSVYEDFDAYEQSGQLEYALGNIRWVNDYLIKCHTAEFEYYYQVGNGSADHSWWGPAEALAMDRPSYKVTLDSPGSAVVAEAAASLAACTVVFKDADPDYAEKCLLHAKQLFDFADRTKSDSGYTMADGFYTSWSGFNDELSWAGTWLYTATGDSAYLDKAKSYFEVADANPEWTMCWDNVTSGAAMRLAQIENGGKYAAFLDENMDFWLNRITYTPDGLAWLDEWGSLRYATTAAFIAAVYSECDFCPADKAEKYWSFAVSQVDYALGSSGRSFVCGFGENYPVNPHHRTAQGSYCDNMNEPSTARHTLYGALVGGPGADGSYSDVVSDYNKNEVACDYNAGFTGVLAKLYTRYHGQTLLNFGAVEVPDAQELYVDACVNASGNGFTEVKAIVFNTTAWPARITDKLELRYYFDLSEGGSPSDISVTTNYMQGGKCAGIMSWDEEKNLYYVSIDFSGEQIRPGGQDAYKREVQFRILSSTGVWDPSNDPSYASISGTSGGAVRAESIALYDGGKLVFGAEPDGSGVSVPAGTGEAATGTVPAATQPSASANPTAQSGDFSVTLENMSGKGSSLSFTLMIKNVSSKPVNLSTLQVLYYFTKDGGGDCAFSCDHSAAVNGDSYVSLSAINGSFSSASGSGADTVMTVSCGDNVSLEAGGTWKIQLRVNKSDWTDFNPSDDYSAADASNVVILSGGDTVFGTAPKS